MDVMPWTSLLFQSIPEEIILVTLGLALVGKYPRMRGIVTTGIIVAVFSFFFRRLPLGFGIHTLSGIAVMALTMHLVLRLDLWRGLMAAFLSLVALGLVESITIPAMIFLTGIPFERAVTDPWRRILFPLPEEIILALAAYILRRRRISLLPKDEPRLGLTGRKYKEGNK
ncbi:hypothetical protein [Neomoorella humiferrea]|uniref:Uncharacterized protein n=1 Tax=Neomoorella humiferrea TaxID=676965 RepID=A0A2T0AKU8_9FIRM|nr:hypothetical protein [Moorella humiferrea]PRR69199.1 hypothetical protein MOHU_25020 [Moorella humiferrea]